MKRFSRFKFDGLLHQGGSPKSHEWTKAHWNIEAHSTSSKEDIGERRTENWLLSNDKNDHTIRPHSWHVPSSLGIANSLISQLMLHSPTPSERDTLVLGDLNVVILWNVRPLPNVRVIILSWMRPSGCVQPLFPDCLNVDTFVQLEGFSEPCDVWVWWECTPASIHKQATYRGASGEQICARGVFSLRIWATIQFLKSSLEVSRQLSPKDVTLSPMSFKNCQSNHILYITSIENVRVELQVTSGRMSHPVW